MAINILLICHDVDRGDLKQGLPYSKLMDSLHEEFVRRGYRCKQVALPGSLLVGANAWGRPDSFEGYRFSIGIYERLRRKFLLKLFKFLKIERNKKSLKFREKTRKWQAIFNIVKPSAIFVIGATSEMCLAAKKVKIPLLEVLHGLGYSRIEWGWEARHPAELPDFILCLDQTSRRSFQPLEAKGLTIKEIPHPWYKRFMEEKPLGLDPLWLKTLDFIPPGKKVILISLVWGYDGDHGNFTELANIVPNGLMPEALMRSIVATQHEVFYCIRRHPVQLRQQRYDYQIKFLDEFINTHPNCEYVQSSAATLVSLLKRAEGHITLSSMTAYEAALMGVRTLFLSPNLYKGGKNEKTFEDLVAKGYAEKIIARDEDITAWVKNTTRLQPLALTESASEDTWEIFLRGLLPPKA